MGPTDLELKISLFVTSFFTAYDMLNDNDVLASTYVKKLSHRCKIEKYYDQGYMK